MEMNYAEKIIASEGVNGLVKKFTFWCCFHK